MNAPHEFPRSGMLRDIEKAVSMAHPSAPVNCTRPVPHPTPMSAPLTQPSAIATISAKPPQEETMSVRLVVTITAAPGKGAELAEVFRGRCAEVMQEPGCEQFEVFQSVLNPDKLTLLELWKDQAALDVHAKVNETRAPMPAGLRSGVTEREDYEYNRTR
jgi:quinol monooxygenase YgiN